MTESVLDSSMVTDSNKIKDLVIIGAGPAGSLMAILAARSGLDTLLIERKSFPRYKVCGSCLNSVGISILDQIGAGHIVKEFGLPVDHLMLGLNKKQIRFNLPQGVTIPRSLLDQELARLATEAGAQFLSETQATLGQENESSRSIKIISGGIHHEIQAKVVVIASGLGTSAFGNETIFKPKVAKGSRIGTGCVIPGNFPAYPIGCIAMAIGRYGYVGITPTVAGLTVASACDATFLKQKNGPSESAIQILSEAGFSLPDGIQESEWFGTLPITRRTRPVADTRVFLIGDAAGYSEPFTGQGMSIAMQSAVALSPIVKQAAKQWSSQMVSSWSVQYEKQVASRHWPASLVASILKNPMATRSVFAVAGKIPFVPNFLINAVNRPLAETVMS